MPVGISSAARNLFLLGSSGADVVLNFFTAIDQSSSPDDQFVSKAIKYSEYDEKYILGLQAEDGNSKKHALIEKRNGDGVLDWDFEIESLDSSDTILTDIHLDVNGKLIVAGSSGSVPFIARYTNNGGIEWSSTTNSANVRYNGIASDSSGQYYACGNTDESGSAQAFIEKYDATGNPGWGKSAINIGSDIVLHAIDTNNRGEVVAGGYLEDTNAEFKGYFVKLDTTTGEVLWDRTLEITDRDWGSVPVTEINDVMIDGNDFIYIVGSQFAGVSGNSAGFICKYSPEGNMLWQKETPVGAANSGRWRYNCVEADTATGQIVILGSYFEGISAEYGVLVKYSSDGRKIFTRVLESTEASPPEFGTLNTPRGGMALDADPSFYYILFTDQETNPATTIPDKYTFGKVSSSGNGLGAFSYDTGDTNTIEYYIQDIGDRIGRLSDGSVRNDSSDLATNILNPTKIMFDDLATQVTNKKRQMNRADDFEYSGSPAIRPTDFQELNIGDETFNVVEFVTGASTPAQGQQSFTTSGTFTVPANVTQVSAVVVGGGGGGAGSDGDRNEGNTGGGGGGLAYGTFAVTAGESLTVTIGNAGAAGGEGDDGGSGGPTTIARGATVLLSGGGGQGGQERSTTSRAGGASGGTERDGGGTGGSSGSATDDNSGSGGGGAAGYSGNGGAGGTNGGSGSAGSGGGGAGGNSATTGTADGGGGVGILGEGSNGAASGGGGSGGAAHSGFNGGNYGGGGGARDDDNAGGGGAGGAGAARIIWGTGRSYPSTLTEDLTPSSGSSGGGTTQQTVTKVKDKSGKGNHGSLVTESIFNEPNPGFGSVEFDGVDDYLSMPDSQLLEILDANFTVEFWIYVTGDRSQQCIFSKGRNVQCYWNDANTIALYLDSDNSSATGTSGYGVFFNSNLTGTGSVPKNTWRHIAICRDNNTWKAFVDGVQKYSNVIPGLDPVYNSSEDFEIGSYVNNRGQGSLANEFGGYISNFRFLKGTALYSADFTVPTTPLTSTGSDTSLLTCQGDTIVDARTGTANVITANGGVLPSARRVSPSLTDKGYWDFNGTSDFIPTTFPNDAIATGDANSEYTLEAWIYVRTSSGSVTNADGIMGHTTNYGVGMQVGVTGGNPRVNYGGRFTNNFYGLAFNYNEWRHVVLTRDGTNGPIAYENGVEVSRTNNVGDLDVGQTPGDFNIGYCGPRISGYFDGLIGDARVYTRALTPEQVFQNYNSTKTKYIPEPSDTAPRIGPGIVYDSNLLLNYDFGNRVTYDPAENLFANNNDPTVNSSGTATKILVQIKQPDGSIGPAMETDASGFAQNYKNITASSNTAPGYLTFWAKKKSPGSTGTLTITMEGGNTPRSFNSASINSDTWTKISTTHDWSAGTSTLRRFDIYFNGSGNTSDGDTSFYLTNHQFEETTSPGRFVRTNGSSIPAPTTVKNLSNNTATDATNNLSFVGDAFVADGALQCLDYGANGLEPTLVGSPQQFTIEIWLKMISRDPNPGVPPNDYQRIVYSSGISGNVLVIEEGGSVSFRVPGSTNQNNFQTSAFSNNNADYPTEWKHIVCTYDQVDRKVYVDNSSPSTFSDAGATVNWGSTVGQGFAIGDINSAQLLDVNIGEVRFYTRALTAAEVSQNFNATRARYGV